MPRSDGSEVRVNWSEYEGRPFLNIRLWAPCSDGTMRPARDKGLTIRLFGASSVRRGH